MIHPKKKKDNRGSSTILSVRSSQDEAEERTCPSREEADHGA